jgi:hypothetical protein
LLDTWHRFNRGLILIGKFLYWSRVNSGQESCREPRYRTHKFWSFLVVGLMLLLNVPSAA